MLVLVVPTPTLLMVILPVRVGGTIHGVLSTSGEEAHPQRDLQ